MKRIAMLVLLAAAAACTRPVVPAAGPAQGGTTQARWEAQGLRSYRFDLDRHCFCVENAREPVTVTVRDGRVAEVRSRRTGAVMQPSEGISWPTVSELLRQVDEARAAGTETRVEFHASGYPTEVEIGSLAADAGIRYNLANLTPLR